MIDTVVIQPGAETGEPSVAGVSWAAVAAGAIVSCALTLVVLAFGIGLGLSVVSPWGGSGVSATLSRSVPGFISWSSRCCRPRSVAISQAACARDGLGFTATRCISAIPRMAL